MLPTELRERTTPVTRIIDWSTDYISNGLYKFSDMWILKSNLKHKNENLKTTILILKVK